MYTQLIHPWEIEIFFQMIRLIPNYGYTQTRAQASQLIYSGNKTATSCRWSGHATRRRESMSQWTR